MKKTSRKSLRLLGSVGEPINPEAWEWYYHVVGDEPLPDRRYLVADRNRRHPDHAAARRDRPEARLGDAAVLRRQAGRSSTTTARCWKAPADGNLVHRRFAGRARCARSTAITSASSQTYFSTYQGQVFHRRRLPPRRGRLLLDHRPRRRRDQRLRSPPGHGRSRNARSSRTRRSRKPPSSAIRTTSRARASTAYVTLMAGERADGRAAQGARRTGCARKSARSPRPT